MKELNQFEKLIGSYKKPICAASDELLLEPVYRQALLYQLNKLDIPRRVLPDEIMIAIARNTHPILEVKFYDMPEIDELFGNDPEFRALSNILNGAVPRDLDRLRILDLYLRVIQKRHTIR